MYDHKEYTKAVAKTARWCKWAKMRLTVTNLHTGESKTIVDKARNSLDRYDVVFDPFGSKSPMSFPESYYCRTMDELKSLLLFVIKRQKAFVSGIKNDAMDADGIVSFDELMELADQD